MHEKHGTSLVENYWQAACDYCCYLFFGERNHSWINNEEIFPLWTAQETDGDPCRKKTKEKLEDNVLLKNFSRSMH